MRVGLLWRGDPAAPAPTPAQTRFRRIFEAFADREVRAEPVVYDDAVAAHIVSKCNDPDSGGRMIDNIITNTLLPALSREFLKKSLAKEQITQARVSIENNDFAYAWK